MCLGAQEATRLSTARRQLEATGSTKELAFEGQLQSWGSPRWEVFAAHSWGQAGPKWSGRSSEWPAAPASWLARLGPAARGGGGLSESLMNINKWRREKKINLPDPQMGAAVTI